MKLLEGKLSDGKQVLCMISFEPKLRAEVEKVRESREAVAIKNCSVQKVRDRAIVIGCCGRFLHQDDEVAKEICY